MALPPNIEPTEILGLLFGLGILLTVVVVALFHTRRSRLLPSRLANASNAAFERVARRLNLSLRKVDCEGTPMEGPKIFWSVQGEWNGFEIQLEVDQESDIQYGGEGDAVLRRFETVVKIDTPPHKRWPENRVFESALVALSKSVEVDGRRIKIVPKGDRKSKWYFSYNQINLVSNPETLIKVIETAIGIALERGPQ